MPYLPSIVVAAAGVVLLGLLTLQLVMRLRRFRRIARALARITKDRVGLLRARAAGVRVAIARRRTTDAGIGYQ